MRKQATRTTTPVSTGALIRAQLRGRSRRYRLRSSSPMGFSVGLAFRIDEPAVYRNASEGHSFPILAREKIKEIQVLDASPHKVSGRTAAGATVLIASKLVARCLDL